MLSKFWFVIIKKNKTKQFLVYVWLSHFAVHLKLPQHC